MKCQNPEKFQFLLLYSIRHNYCGVNAAKITPTGTTASLPVWLMRLIAWATMPVSSDFIRFIRGLFYDFSLATLSIFNHGSRSHSSFLIFLILSPRPLRLALHYGRALRCELCEWKSVISLF
jgi:hypothetical protein